VSVVAERDRLLVEDVDHAIEVQVSLQRLDHDRSIAHPAHLYRVAENVHQIGCPRLVV
jgi:hypothetical protein